jgi:hypothetical protein
MNLINYFTFYLLYLTDIYIILQRGGSRFAFFSDYVLFFLELKSPLVSSCKLILEMQLITQYWKNHSRELGNKV